MPAHLAKPGFTLLECGNILLYSIFAEEQTLFHELNLKKSFVLKASEMPGQTLPYPAKQSDMAPQPGSDLSNYKPAGKLKGKVALITGARFRASGGRWRSRSRWRAPMSRSSITRTIPTPLKPSEWWNRRAARCLVIKGDVRHSQECRDAVAQVVAEYGGSEYFGEQRRFPDVAEAI